MPELVSIIMPAYNAGRHIGEAVRSVLAQSHPYWELLIVDDGSTDGTAALLQDFNDARIKVFHQSNQGVSAARNKALDHVTGSFICFLDADDMMPVNSISARLAVFHDQPNTDIVDGSVLMMDSNLASTHRKYVPSFTGQPLLELVRLTGSCFCGNTWMMRWEHGRTTRFVPGLTHAEDLLFYMEYAPGRQYRFTKEVVLHYRRSEGSSMSDLAGLERSYYHVLAWIDEHPDLVPKAERNVFRRRIRRIMIGSYWHAGLPLSALASLLRGSRRR